ncbi:MAG: hypothetical protein AB1449_12910 [Chloroflexota bacterium]
MALARLRPAARGDVSQRVDVGEGAVPGRVVELPFTAETVGEIARHP